MNSDSPKEDHSLGWYNSSQGRVDIEYKCRAYAYGVGVKEFHLLSLIMTK